MSETNEASLRAESLRLFRKKHYQAVVFRHEDSLRAGIPDTSIGWHRVTSWIEFKYAAPKVKWRGAQSAEMVRLHSTGIPAFFVIYRETKEDGQHTLIIPATLEHKNFKNALYAPGFNHEFLIQFIERVHGWTPGGHRDDNGR